MVNLLVERNLYDQNTSTTDSIATDTSLTKDISNFLGWQSNVPYLLLRGDGEEPPAAWSADRSASVEESLFELLELGSKPNLILRLASSLSNLASSPSELFSPWLDLISR